MTNTVERDREFDAPRRPPGNGLLWGALCGLGAGIIAAVSFAAIVAIVIATGDYYDSEPMRFFTSLSAWGAPIVGGGGAIIGGAVGAALASNGRQQSAPHVGAWVAAGAALLLSLVAGGAGFISRSRLLLIAAAAAAMAGAVILGWGAGKVFAARTRVPGEPAHRPLRSAENLGFSRDNATSREQSAVSPGTKPPPKPRVVKTPREPVGPPKGGIGFRWGTLIGIGGALVCNVALAVLVAVLLPWLQDEPWDTSNAVSVFFFYILFGSVVATVLGGLIGAFAGYALGFSRSEDTAPRTAAGFAAAPPAILVVWMSSVDGGWGGLGPLAIVATSLVLITSFAFIGYGAGLIFERKLQDPPLATRTAIET